MFFVIYRVILFQLFLIFVAMIESTFAIPFITVTLYLLQIRTASSTLFYIITMFVSLVVATIFMQTWLPIFFIFMLAGLVLRANPVLIQGSFYKVLLLVIMSAGLISLIAKPIFSNIFVLHSLLSFATATLICHRWFSIKSNKLKWNDVRFGGKD